MKSYSVLGAMILVGALTACGGPPTPAPTATLTPVPLPTATPTPAFDRQAETYRVYAAVLSRYCRRGTIALDPNSPSYISKDYGAGFVYYDDEPIVLEHSTWRDFMLEETPEPFALDPDYDYGRTVELMSYSEFAELVEEQGAWESFREANPSHCGHRTLSRVGFNETYTQAVVNETVGDFEAVTLLLLQKQDNEWEVTAESFISIE